MAISYDRAYSSCGRGLGGHHDDMNLVVRGAAEIVGLLCSLVTTLWISRIVGPSYFGYYAVMVTVVAIGALAINAGLSNAGAQRVANNPNRAGEVMWIVTVGRAALALVAVSGGLIVLAVAPIDPVLGNYLKIGLVVWALLPFRYEWLLVAQGQLRSISAIRVIASVATAVSAIVLIRNESNADRLAWIPVMTAIASASGSSLVAHRLSPLRHRDGMKTIAILREYLRDGLHYLKSDVSVFIFTSSDRIFLYAFTTPVVVGLYEAAYRVIQPFYTISAVVGDAMYLQLARAYGKPHLRSTLRRYVDLMCFGTIPLGFFLVAFAPTLISTLYGENYAAASEYLAILGWVITFGYTSGVAVIPFTAWNRPREYGSSTALGGAINLALNIALIPMYQGFGAAWATLAAKIVVTLAGIRHFRRATDYPLVRDFAEYVALSAAAFAIALAVTKILLMPAVVGAFAFGLTYVALVALVRRSGRDR